MQNVLWLIPFLPLFGFAALVLVGRRLGDPTAGWFATLVVAASFVVTGAVFLELLSRSGEDRVLHQSLFTWIPAGGFSVDFGFLADPLSILMCLFVTFIGALIHMYSVGYMKDDPDYAKFFVYLNLFVASMLFLVLGDNLLMTFLGWEGVGLCSYLLISFWFTDAYNASAGKKAFVTSRIGDVGFMLGTFLVWVTFGTLNYTELFHRVEVQGIAAVTATAIVLLFFLAATGKSAQIPLYVWLPDAMAGPTPVSALIHAATMVTAGVFLLTRLNPILAHAGWANDVIIWVGLATALVAALSAVAQNDIKKVLAYSTVSQLGYMFTALGAGAFAAGMFHMITHAFFKALLFLGSGSVIKSMAHEQDMRRYGRLRRFLPITSVTMIIASLAISGIPPFSGFWSKDDILAALWADPGFGALEWAVGVLVALLTAFYMFRLVFMTFYGDRERWREPIADDADFEHHLTPDHTPRESPWTMTVPLIVLAVGAIGVGAIELPFSESVKGLEHWLDPVLVHRHEALPGLDLFALAAGAFALAASGIWFAYWVYQRKKVDPARIEKPAFAHALYINDTYAKVAGGPGRDAFQGVADFDEAVVDGTVDGAGFVARSTGRALRPLQNGLVRSYALAVAGGAALLLAFVVMRMSL